MKVRWAKGYRGKGDAVAIHRELENLRAKTGDLNPQDIVEMARPKGSPAHGEFTWSNKVAAEQYRLEQARKMVRSIVVLYKETPKAGPQRAYVQITRSEVKNDEVQRKRVYTDVRDALKDPETRAEILSRAISEAASYRKKYAHLSELAVVLNAIDLLLVSQK
jgi:hypothetical protein